MDIRHLKILIAIADYKTFVAAGNAVGLTQSAISQHVRKTEDELQIKLFDRTSRPPVLTVQGQTLIAGAREVVAQYERIIREVTGDRLLGNLFLGSIQAALTGLLPEALSNLRVRYPELQISVNSGRAEELVSMVETGRLDAAVVPEPPVLSERLRWTPFAIEPLVVIAPKSVPEKTDKELLEAYPYIRFKSDARVADTIDNEIRQRGIETKLMMDIESFSSIVLMVHHGLGVAVVPNQGALRPFPENIRTVPFGKPPLQRTMGVVDKNTSSSAQIVDALHLVLCRLSDTVDQ
ncbi:MAG: LysR family transcriptional regulator [Marinosulfonomonas sp.]|nr:LysR family transcriptional regulator [Marinosulfonomonas sp.]